MHFGLLKARGFYWAVTGQQNIQPVNGPKLHCNSPNIGLLIFELLFLPSNHFSNLSPEFAG